MTFKKWDKSINKYLEKNLRLTEIYLQKKTYIFFQILMDLS